MAITWGAIQGPGSSKMRIGVEISTSTLEGSVSCTGRVYVWTRWGVSDSSNSCTTSGAASSSGSVSVSTSVSSGTGWSTSNQQLIRTVTWSAARRYPHAGGALTQTLSAALSGIDAVGAGLVATAAQSVTIPARAYSVPVAPSSVSNSRASDVRNNVSWANNGSTAGYYSDLCIERQANGGSWIQLAKIAGTATSYADTSTSVNSSYAYRVRAYNAAGYSSYGTSGTTYNTPSAPTGLAAAKTGESSVSVTWSNPGRTETATEVARSANGGQDWATVHTTGADATGWIDASAPGGTLIYRARNTRGALSSAWSAASNPVTTLQPPAAPTITTRPPAVVPTDTGNLVIGWVHNSLDSSVQSARKVQSSVNGAAPHESTEATTATWVAFDPSDFDDGDTLSVRVATKGAHAEFGPLSDAVEITFYDNPSAAITSPANDSAVETTAPITVEWDYAGHALAVWALDVYEGDILRHRATGTDETSYSLGLDTFLPRTGSQYVLSLTATDIHGLSTRAARAFAVDYDEPAAPSLTYEIDERSASVQLNVFAGEEDGAPETESLSIERDDGDGQTTIIADGLGPGSVVIDRFPRLNVDNVYLVRAHAASGATRLVEETVVVKSEHNHFAFGERCCSIAANLSFGGSADAGTRYFRFAGRRWPVLFSGAGRDADISCSGELFEDPEQEAAFEALMLWGDAVLYRDIRGRRLTVGAKVRMSEPAGAARIVRVDVEMRRIET